MPYAVPRSRRRPLFARPVRAGFSLLELMVVLVLFAILTSAVVPVFSSSLRAARVDNATRDLAALIKYAQQRAIFDTAEYRLFVQPESGRYWLLREQEPSEAEGQAGREEPSRRRSFWHRDEDTRKFEPLPEVRTAARRLPEGIAFLRPDARSDHESNAYYVAFYPSGACDTATLRLIHGDRRRVTIDIGGSLGKVEVTER